MFLRDDEIEEYFRMIKKQRDSYKSLLSNICTGVPATPGMASEYRRLTLKEIEQAAKELIFN